MGWQAELVCKRLVFWNNKCTPIWTVYGLGFGLRGPELILELPDLFVEDPNCINSKTFRASLVEVGLRTSAILLNGRNTSCKSALELTRYAFPL